MDLWESLDGSGDRDTDTGPEEPMASYVLVDLEPALEAFSAGSGCAWRERRVRREDINGVKEGWQMRFMEGLLVGKQGLNR